MSNSGLLGKIVFLGVQRDDTYKISQEVKSLTLFVGDGITNDRHKGVVRLVDAREKVIQHYGIPKKSPMVNLRQITIITKQELHQIAINMELPTCIPYGLLGENIVIDIPSLPAFTKICVPGTKLFFRSGSTARMASIFVTGENTPCHIPAENIFSHFDQPDRKPSDFINNAKGLRGVTGIVMTFGQIQTNDDVLVHLHPSS